MTTAHRPTFDPARGKAQLKGPAYHQRLLPAHKQLKLRQKVPDHSRNSNTIDLRAETLHTETPYSSELESLGKQSISDPSSGANTKRRLLSSTGETASDELLAAQAKRRRLILDEAKKTDAESDISDSDASDGSPRESDDRDYGGNGGYADGSKRDDEADDNDDDDEDDNDDDDDDDDDDDEELGLQRELAKVKAERAERKAAEEAESALKETEQRESDIARGNPLLNTTDFAVKRRWDDDVVFRNQARGTEEKAKNKEFVNDLLRSDFHKRFMSKYVR